jgi:hypothetical protein
MRFDHQTTVVIGQQIIGETVVVVAVEQSIQTKKHLMMNNNKPNQNKTFDAKSIKPKKKKKMQKKRRRMGVKLRVSAVCGVLVAWTLVVPCVCGAAADHATMLPVLFVFITQIRDSISTLLFFVFFCAGGGGLATTYSQKLY